MKVKLGDICTIKSSKRIFEKEYVPSGIPFIRGQEISDGSIKQKNGKFQCCISKERFDQLKEKNGVPQKNDILITAVGTIGNLFYVDREFDFYFKDGNVIWLTDFNKLVYPKYLYFFMKSQYFLKQLEYAMIGAVQKALTMVMLSKIEFELPSYDKQKRIASWLEIIDNKIDNNNKVISELEKMSKTIYDYWFLQYEFPNEEGKPYKSLGGKMVWNEELKKEIPDGWKFKKIVEIEDNIVTGKTPSTKDETNFGGEIPFVTIDDIRKGMYISKTERTLSKKGADLQKNKYIPANSLCITCIATVGLVGITTRQSQTNQQINSIICKNTNNIYFLLNAIRNYFKFSTGAKSGNIFDNMNKEDFSNIKLIYPNKNIIDKYAQKVKPVYDKIREKFLENEELASLRDYLLPLLMNGQVGFKN